MLRKPMYCATLPVTQATSSVAAAAANASRVAVLATDAPLAALQWKEALPLQMKPPMVTPDCT